jgi:hypothetical protein
MHKYKIEAITWSHILSCPMKLHNLICVEVRQEAWLITLLCLLINTILNRTVTLHQDAWSTYHIAIPNKESFISITIIISKNRTESRWRSVR